MRNIIEAHAIEANSYSAKLYVLIDIIEIIVVSKYEYCLIILLCPKVLNSPIVEKNIVVEL